MSDGISGGVDLLSRSRGIFLGAAIGDALGWPQEQRSGIAGGQKERDVEQPLPQFRSWIRNSGTQYQKYAESVAAGEYSDDTQLILAVARSVVSDHWYDVLTQSELPAWLLYQRGGGGATLRACRTWSTGVPPWMAKGSKAADTVAAYFRAGGNGVAMRIAPHVVVTSKNSVKELVARVVLDGVTTHGHPRALVGAAVYAVALRIMLAQSGTLGYGQLIDALIDETAWQDYEIAERDIPPSWFEAEARARENGNFRNEWRATVEEMLELLRIARGSLSQGSLANDTELLKKLGTFDKKLNGAGTVTAAGAIYLSARTATRPMSGLLRAAFLKSADTDTLASMTAAVLGALHGHEWLGELRNRVQDRIYIRDLADHCYQVVTGTPVSRAGTIRDTPVTDRMLRDYLRIIEKPEPNMGRFVDGRRCRVLGRQHLDARGNIDVSRYTIDVEGQTIHVDDVRRLASKPSRASGKMSSFHQVTLLVSNLGPVERFYRMVLQLPIRGTDEGDIVVCDRVRFMPDYHSRLNDAGATRGLLLSFDVADLEIVRERLIRDGVKFTTVDRDRNRSIRVADPAGNDVDIRQSL